MEASAEWGGLGSGAPRRLRSRPHSVALVVLGQVRPWSQLELCPQDLLSRSWELYLLRHMEVPRQGAEWAL